MITWPGNVPLFFLWTTMLTQARCCFESIDGRSSNFKISNLCVCVFDRRRLMFSMVDLLFYTITDGKEMIPFSQFISVSQHSHVLRHSWRCLDFRWHMWKSTKCVIIHGSYRYVSPKITQSLVKLIRINTWKPATESLSISSRFQVEV